MKMYVLIPKKPTVTDVYFHEHWRTVHADLARQIPTLTQYTQLHATDGARFRGPYSAGGFDGVSQAWFASDSHALTMSRTSEYKTGALQDEPLFMDIPRKVRVFTQVCQSQEPASTPSSHLHQLLVFTRLAPGVEADLKGRLREESWKDWNALGYSWGKVREQVGDVGVPRFDYVEELWWEERSDMIAAFEQTRLGEDIDARQSYVDPGSIMLSGWENRVIRPHRSLVD
ncbi:EthD domain-containing protein [Rhodococcus sp. ACPA1]|uniref:EthD domain-containing protein n=1 Tax=Rhodococcus sp. ACPA1 TaxID=2028572 RepID=UPI0015CCB99C|nr:EthD domain-containing protein [Rhodococcus sp. ACPA1]